MPSPYFDNYGMVAVTAATLSVIAGAHVGSRINLNRAAGIAVTLPKATGSGNRYEFIVQATVTGSTTIKVVDSVDVMTGLGYVLGAAAASFATVAASDTITMNGTTTGGITGSRVVLDDLAAGVWGVMVDLSGSGTAATPFSATV